MTSLLRLALPLALLTALPAARAAPMQPASLSDSQLARAITARLAGADAAAAIHVTDVAVRDGAVVLTGSARTRFAREAAVRVVGEMPGVQRVEAHLRVEPNP